MAEGHNKTKDRDVNGLSIWVGRVDTGIRDGREEHFLVIAYDIISDRRRNRLVESLHDQDCKSFQNNVLHS